jgi:transposase InsO family protein
VQQGPAPRHGTLQSYEATGPWDRIHVDLTGPHPPSRQGAVYILTVLDAFTGYLIAVPLKNKTALTVAEALVQNVFLPFGSCQSLVSDQGTEFCNIILEEVTKLLGIRKLRTSAYRAFANGRVERVHRTMNTLLSRLVSDNQSDWQTKLPFVVTAINAS